MLLPTPCISTYLSLVVLGLPILSECENEQIVLFIIRINPNIGNLMDLVKVFQELFLVSCYFTYFVYQLRLQVALYVS